MQSAPAVSYLAPRMVNTARPGDRHRCSSRLLAAAEAQPETLKEPKTEPGVDPRAQCCPALIVVWHGAVQRTSRRISSSEVQVGVAPASDDRAARKPSGGDLGPGIEGVAIARENPHDAPKRACPFRQTSIGLGLLTADASANRLVMVVARCCSMNATNWE